MLMKKVVLSKNKKVIATIPAPKELKQIKVGEEVYKLSDSRRFLRKVDDKTPTAVDWGDGTWKIHSAELRIAIQTWNYNEFVRLTKGLDGYVGFVWIKRMSILKKWYYQPR